MASNLSVETRRDMAMNGLGIAEIIGSGHMVDMYLHLDKKNDKVFGDVFMKIRVGDPRNFPKNLNNSEMDHLNRKMRQLGVSPWRPGDECLKRKFEPYWDITDASGRARQQYGKPTMGCKPCRIREEARLSGLTAATTEVDESLDSTVSEEPSKTTTPVVQPEATTCDECDYAVKSFTAKGKPMTEGQMRNSLRLHMKKHNKESRTAVKSAVPA